MNASLNILNNPAHPIKQESGWLERHPIVKAIEEKVNDAIAEYDNPEQHEGIYGYKVLSIRMSNDYNHWLYYLN